VSNVDAATHTHTYAHTLTQEEASASDRQKLLVLLARVRQHLHKSHVRLEHSWADISAAAASSPSVERSSMFSSDGCDVASRQVCRHTHIHTRDKHCLFNLVVFC